VTFIKVENDWKTNMTPLSFVCILSIFCLSSNLKNNVKDLKMEVMNMGGVSADQLRLIIDKIERLEEEKVQLGEHINDVYSEAKAEGFDVKTIRTVVRMRKMKPEEMNEQEEMLEIYLSALGMRRSEQKEAS